MRGLCGASAFRELSRRPVRSRPRLGAVSGVGTAFSISVHG